MSVAMMTESQSVADRVETLKKLWSEYKNGEYELVLIACKTGRVLNELHKELGPKRFSKEVLKKLPYSDSKARTWMSIAKYWEDIKNSKEFGESGTITTATQLASRYYQQDNPSDGRANNGPKGKAPDLPAPVSKEVKPDVRLAPNTHSVAAVFPGEIQSAGDVEGVIVKEGNAKEEGKEWEIAVPVTVHATMKAVMTAEVFTAMLKRGDLKIVLSGNITDDKKVVKGSLSDVVFDLLAVEVESAEDV